MNIRRYKIATAAAVTLLLMVASSLGFAAAQNFPPSATPDQLAAAIARTMNATKPSTTVTSPIKQEFVADKNVVETRTIFRSADSLENAAAQRQKLQITSTRYMCKAERLFYIKKGVVFRDVFTGPDSIGGFSFVIDERACASLEKPVIADTTTLTNMADAISKIIPNEQAFAGSLFAGLTTQEGVINLTYDIVAPAFVDFFRYKAYEIRGKTQGLYCQKFGDAIRRGVRIQVIFKLKGSPPILEFPVDDSIC